MTAKLLFFIRSHAFVLLCRSENCHWRWNFYHPVHICKELHVHPVPPLWMQPPTTSPAHQSTGVRSTSSVYNWSERYLQPKRSLLTHVLATHSLHFHQVDLVTTWLQDRSIWLADLMENKGNKWKWLCSWNREEDCLWKRLLVFSSF